MSRAIQQLFPSQFHHFHESMTGYRFTSMIIPRFERILRETHIESRKTYESIKFNHRQNSFSLSSKITFASEFLPNRQFLTVLTRHSSLLELSGNWPARVHPVYRGILHLSYEMNEKNRYFRCSPEIHRVKPIVLRCV